MMSATATERDVSSADTSLPSLNVTSASFTPASGKSFIFFASRSSSLRTFSAAAPIAPATEAAIQEPPSTGDAGRLESPSLTVMLSMGSPSMSAASCAMIV